ncbi:MAG TPA: cyclic nucleotide-binding domain-containing protein [Burkholderiales bacterium]|nr:cyclic nucleotide-binding domain-containing protein [Burkholderiales bacterium]
MSRSPSIDGLYLRIVSEVELFRHLGRAQVRTLLRNATKSVFSAGEVVYNEGDQGQCLYVVLQGNFEVYRQVNGRHAELGHVLPGEHFGEISLMTHGERSATVRALGESTALRFTKEALLSKPEIAVQVMKNMTRMLANRLVTADEEVILYRNRTQELEKQAELATLQLQRKDSRVRKVSG